MEQAEVFETLTVLRSQLVKWPSVLSQVTSLIESSQIKIVDIRRHKDELTIIYRRLPQ